LRWAPGSAELKREKEERKRKKEGEGAPAHGKFRMAAGSRRLWRGCVRKGG